MKFGISNYCKFGKDCVGLIFAFFMLRLTFDAKLKFAMISAATLSVWLALYVAANSQS